MINPEFWRGKRVFLTGHTGFKGSWLSLWLLEMGAEVTGYALAPESKHDLFNVLELENSLTSVIDRLENYQHLETTIAKANPDIILHLAAQPLVRLSYDIPIDTISTNVMGTAYVLDAMRRLPNKGAAVIVTSDKCYENREKDVPFKEDDPMGGFDIYSMSKGAAELVVTSYRKSFFENGPWTIASGRSGNIFGGGDWADARIIPDYFRAINENKSLTIRSPKAIRPWLFVLDSLAGYLMLAEQSYHQAMQTSEKNDAIVDVASGWNFGPKNEAIKTVESLLQEFDRHVPEAPEIILDTDDQPYEAKLLKLDCTKAQEQLGWYPLMGFEEGARKTADWYSAFQAGVDMKEFSRGQIKTFMNKMAEDSPTPL